MSFRFAGNKCSYRDVAQRFSMAVSALHKSVDRVMDFLLEKSPSTRMPLTEIEKECAAAEFRKVIHNAVSSEIFPNYY